MWPAVSSDLNLKNFLVWSMLKAKVSSVAYQSIGSLKPSLLRVCAKIYQETLRASVGNFRQRIILIIEKKGNLIENKHFKFTLSFLINIFQSS